MTVTCFAFATAPAITTGMLETEAFTTAPRCISETSCSSVESRTADLDKTLTESVFLVAPAAKFAKLAKEWHEETRYSSSAIGMVLHPAYQEIMQMREEALPYILKDLEEHGGHWFFALQTITRTVLGEPSDSFETIRQLWLNWGHTTGKF